MPADAWVVYDTNVYVDAIRGADGNPAERRLEDTADRTWLVAVVAAELRAGAVDQAGRAAVDAFVRRSATLSRLLVPTFADWQRAGTLLAALRLAEPGFRSKLATLWNDTLITVTAARVGATVVTRDLGDFRLLTRHLPVTVTVV
jgi:predicted nucleic acid-binding protein